MRSPCAIIATRQKRMRSLPHFLPANLPSMTSIAIKNAVGENHGINRVYKEKTRSCAYFVFGKTPTQLHRAMEQHTNQKKQYASEYKRLKHAFIFILFMLSVLLVISCVAFIYLGPAKNIPRYRVVPLLSGQSNIKKLNNGYHKITAPAPIDKSGEKWQANLAGAQDMIRKRRYYPYGVVTSKKVNKVPLKNATSAMNKVQPGMVGGKRHFICNNNKLCYQTGIDDDKITSYTYKKYRCYLLKNPIVSVSNKKRNGIKDKLA